MTTWQEDTKIYTRNRMSKNFIFIHKIYFVFISIVRQ